MTSPIEISERDNEAPISLADVKATIRTLTAIINLVRPEMKSQVSALLIRTYLQERLEQEPSQ